MRIAPLVGIAIGLSGCVHNHSAGVGSLGLFAAQGLGQTATGPATPAETPTGKLTLARAYAMALERSEEVALADAAVTEGEIRRSEKLTEVGPTVALKATGVLQRERVVGTNVLTPGEQLIGGVTVEQPIFRRGFFASRESAAHRQQAAREALARAREQLAHDVVIAFVAVLRSRKLVALANTAVSRAKAQYDHASGRVRAGSALKSVEMLALVDFKRAERQHVAAQQELGDAAAAFRRVVGIAPPPDLETPSIPSDLPDPPRALDIARRRHDVAALEQRVREAQLDAEAVAGRRFWPRLDVAGAVDYLSPAVLGRNVDWRVLGVLTIPIFETGREHTELALRANATRIAKLELEQRAWGVTEEIERSSERLVTTLRATELAASQLAAANDLYKLVDKQFRLGAITFLEVTNAQAVLVEAENAFEIAQMDRILAVYTYLFAIGALKLD